MDDKTIKRKQVISVLLWTIGSYVVLMFGRIEPAVFLQLGIASLFWIAGYTLMIILTPATGMLLIADYFWFVKGKTKDVTARIILGIISVISIIWIYSIVISLANSSFRDVTYLAIAMAGFFAQVISRISRSEQTWGKGSFRFTFLASGFALSICSTTLFVLLGTDLTYRDPVPMGLLIAAGLFVVILEKLQLSYMPRFLIALLTSFGLLVALFFGFGFALSLSQSWAPDYAWSTLTSPDTIASLQFASVSLVVFMLAYVIIRRQHKAVGK
jgi:hypothetical protein